MGKKLLITGGAGFIGSHFIKYMLKKYETYQIINLDLLTYAGDLENLADIKNRTNYRFVKGDICDAQLIDQIVQAGIDFIVNFAAESHVDRSIEDPGIFVKTNIMGTRVLLDSAKKYSVKKYIQISTDEVYGSLDQSGYFTEDTPLAPNSPYSASKAGADMLVRSYYKTFNLPVNITRCSNNYGPYQYPEKLIPLVISKAIKGKAIPVYGDGLQIRDWLYVKDHCTAIDMILHQGKIGEIYNIGGTNEKTNISIIQLILEQLGKPESLIRYVEDRPGHDRRYAISSKKIQAELGWIPEYKFESGLKDTIEWYLNNQQWWTGKKYSEFVR